MSGDMSIRRLLAELDRQAFFSAPEACTLLRMNKRTLWKMCRSGEIPGNCMAGRWRIPTWWLRQQVSGRQDGNDGRAA